MMDLEKRLCPSAKISYTVSCNVSLCHDTKEMIYRYTQNVYCCISSCEPANLPMSYTIIYGIIMMALLAVAYECVHT